MVTIDSKKHKEIIDNFKEINYWHGFKILESVSGYTEETIYSIQTVMLLLEYKDMKNRIIKIDPNAWITRTPINDLTGNFDYSRID